MKFSEFREKSIGDRMEFINTKGKVHKDTIVVDLELTGTTILCGADGKKYPGFRCRYYVLEGKDKGKLYWTETFRHSSQDFEDKS